MPCRAMTSKHARYCELAEQGDAGYIALLCDDPIGPDSDDRAAIELRRAGKIRVALGVKVQPDPQKR